MRAPLALDCSPSPASMTPAFTSSSLYFPISVVCVVVSRTPASLSALAFTSIMNFGIVVSPFGRVRSRASGPLGRCQSLALHWRRATQTEIDTAGEDLSNGARLPSVPSATTGCQTASPRHVPQVCRSWTIENLVNAKLRPRLAQVLEETSPAAEQHGCQGDLQLLDDSQVQVLLDHIRSTRDT